MARSKPDPFCFSLGGDEDGSGGVVCGDDFSTPLYGVIAAVHCFARERQAGLQIAAPKWVMQKTLSAEGQMLLGHVEQRLAGKGGRKGQWLVP
jgi:hypothetical protein